MSNEMETAIDTVEKKLSKWELKFACHRCKRDHQDISEITQFVGGYTARLCTDCINAWHEHAQDLPAWKRFRDAVDLKQIYALAQNTHEAKAQMEIEQAARDELYALGKAWMESVQ